MTSIVCWFNKEEHAPGPIWTIGDSKISDGGINASTLLDSGAKIFSIPLVCNKPGESGFFDSTYIQSKLGLAYAGNSLVGLNVQAAISTVFSSLNGLGVPPSMDDLGEYVRMISESYIRQLSIIRQDKSLSSFLLMGFCFKSEMYKVCKITPSLSTGDFKMTLEVFDTNNSSDDKLFIIGDKTSEIESSINSYRESIGEKNLKWYRAPQHILKKIISEQKYSTIGGYLQLGYCTGTNFTLSSSYENGILSYLGFNVSGDASKVGECFVGMPGML